MARKGEVCSQKVTLSLQNKYRQFFNYSNRHGAKNDHPQQNYWERDAVRDIYEPVMHQVHSTFLGTTVQRGWVGMIKSIPTCVQRQRVVQRSGDF